ncbi:MAG: phosphohistidine phosphatase SixA [Deltaproteobacteria bacterium]|nr:phosphohistidine phosphatase SixA [Deltaproteobacteria bacterium]
MKLFIIRHGECEEGFDDAARALTPEGIQDIHHLQATFSKLNIKPDLVLVSPFRRAQETAAILNQFWNLLPVTVSWLEPSTSVSRVLQELKPYESDAIVLVSHMPLLGHLAGALIEGIPAPTFLIHRGECLELELDKTEPGSARLLQKITPSSK